MAPPMWFERLLASFAAALCELLGVAGVDSRGRPAESRTDQTSPIVQSPGY